MRQHSNQLRLHALILAVTILCGSCGWYREPAPGEGSGTEPAPVAGSGAEPARVALLTDDAAQSFLDGTWPASGERAPPPPEVGQVVLAGGDQGEVFAFVLGRNEAEARQQLGRLKTASVEVQDCEPGSGDTCCDLNSQIWVVDSEFEGERFWLSLGVSCPPSRVQEGATVGEPPVNWPRFDFVEVRPDIWNAMAERGVTHPFMTLAKDNRELQVLVDPARQIGELRTPPTMHQRAFQGGSPIILAHHADPPPPLSGDCADSVNSCKSRDGYLGVADLPHDGQRHRARHHWYVWDEEVDEWCEMVWRCGRCPRPPG